MRGAERRTRTATLSIHRGPARIRWLPWPTVTAPADASSSPPPPPPGSRCSAPGSSPRWSSAASTRTHGHRGRPAELALQLAERKARRSAPRTREDALVLGCDSVLELDGEALGKPARRRGRRARWRPMRGRSGVLQTGHCLDDTRTGRDAGAAPRPPCTSPRSRDDGDRGVRRDRRAAARSPGRSPSTGSAARSSAASRATTTTWSACRCRCCATCSSRSGARCSSCDLDVPRAALPAAYLDRRTVDKCRSPVAPCCAALPQPLRRRRPRRAVRTDLRTRRELGRRPLRRARAAPRRPVASPARRRARATPRGRARRRTSAAVALTFHGAGDAATDRAVLGCAASTRAGHRAGGRHLAERGPAMAPGSWTAGTTWATTRCTTCRCAASRAGRAWRGRGLRPGCCTT